MNRSWYVRPDQDGVHLGKPLNLSCAFLAGVPGTGRYLVGATVNPKNKVYLLRKQQGAPLVVLQILWAQHRGGKRIVEAAWPRLSPHGPSEEGWFTMDLGMASNVLHRAATEAGIKTISQGQLIDAVARNEAAKTRCLLESIGAAHLV